jgi:hypothetical protein
VCLAGWEPAALENAWREQDLVDWCRVFLPYHRITLARRIEHSSRSINFCQIASLRLYLEKGEKETDPEIIRTRYQEVFEGEGPDDGLWDYMLLDKPGRRGSEEYRATTSFLLKEYDHIESLL